MNQMLENPILQNASQQQQLAADPSQSVWVGANAGTGKTRVLITRMLNLLLQLFVNNPTANPKSIVALTFTRAAAQEMLERLNSTLQEWQNSENKQEVVTQTLGRTPTQKELEALPHMLEATQSQLPQITTLHGFCQTILQRFPLEAGVPPQFTLMQDDEPKLLWESTLAKVLNEDLPDHLAMLGAGTIRQYLTQMWHKREKLPHLATLNAKHAYAQALDLAEALDLDLNPADCENEELTNTVPPQNIAENLKAQITPDLIESAGKTSQKLLLELKAFLNQPAEIQTWQEEKYQSLFFTKDNKPRAKLLDKSTAASAPNLADMLEQEQNRLVILKQQKALQTAWQVNVELLNIMQQALHLYQTAKYTQGALDFVDLITATEGLLKQSKLKDWVRYRLDAQIQHILLDEAQDTDAVQWSILKPLIDEFFAGEGQNEQPRTLFVVGDEKQAIYRFRGAQADVFTGILEDMKHMDPQHLRHKKVSLQASFRTSSAILQVVDKINTQATHQAVHQQRYGMVKLYGLQPYVAATKPEPWQMVTPNQNETRQNETLNANAWQNLSTQIAQTCVQILSRNTPLACTEKLPQPEDILILLRNRTQLKPVIFALGQAALPVWVADDGQGGLDHPIVQDCLALLRILRTPQEDAKLAQALLSPFFNWSQEQLKTASLNRAKNQSLWNSITQINNETVSTLKTLQTYAKTHSVHATLQHSLSTLKAQGQFAQRFGGNTKATQSSTEGVLQSLLNAAERFTTLNPEGSLAQFEVSLQTTGLSLKSENAPAGAIVIRTVHGAKGLEAPIVILPDTTSPYSKSINKESVLWTPNGLPVVRLNPATPLQDTLIEKEKQEIQKDEENLLYVALTRAKEELHIFGAEPYGGLKPDCWYSAVKEIATPEHNFSQQGEVFITESGTRPTAQNRQEETERQLTPLPKWYKTKAEQTAVAEEKEDTNGDTARGTALHALWQTEGKFADMDVLTQQEREEALTQIQKAKQEYPWLFGENSAAEVALSEGGDSRKVGQKVGIIDRLVILPDEIRIIDYKTHPKPPNQMPQTYRSQLQRYTKLVQPIAQNKPIKAAIYWTAINKLEWL